LTQTGHLHQMWRDLRFYTTTAKPFSPKQVEVG
jgi:hypothetical protein